MKNIIIAQVPESDRNIYLTIVDGELYSVNYSQGIDDIDLHFATTHNQGITQFVYNELQKQEDELYSIDFFFPSPYWDQQVKVIDDAIWKLIKQENERADLIDTINKLEKQLIELKAQL